MERMDEWFYTIHKYGINRKKFFKKLISSYSLLRVHSIYFNEALSFLKKNNRRGK